jgi:hypothetical protein
METNRGTIMLSTLCTVIAVLLFVTGVYLLRERMRGTSSTSYVILTTTSTISLSIALLNAYAGYKNIMPPSAGIHYMVLGQQMFTLLGVTVIHWRMYKTFKLGFCNKAYACPVVDDELKPIKRDPTKPDLPIAVINAGRQ